MRYFVGMAYDRERKIAPGIYLTLLDAGHILGSAMVRLRIEDEATGKEQVLVFSGDIGRWDRPILRDPSYIDEADVLLIESTYGNREHKIDAVSDDELRNVVNAAISRNGKVIIPAFAVGRTQEIVYRLHRLIQAGEVSDKLPVFVDSPLAINATGIYRLHPEGYDQELFDFMMNVKGNDPFGFNMVEYTRSVEQSKAINKINGAGGHHQRERHGGDGAHFAPLEEQCR